MMSTLPNECTCPIAQYCERHRIVKTEHWWELCQHRSDYRALWDSGKGPGQDRTNNRRPVSKHMQIVDVDAYREHWRKLHTQQNATPEWFARWCRHIPNISCNCQQHFAEILKDNPPRYNDWFAWTVEIHNAVNEQLKKPIMSVDDARQIWFSEK